MPARMSRPCVVCQEPTTVLEPVCSDKCWATIQTAINPDSLPAWRNRNDVVAHLVGEGVPVPYIAAWYGLSTHDVREIAAAVVDPRRGSRSVDASGRVRYQQYDLGRSRIPDLGALLNQRPPSAPKEPG